MLVPGSGWRAPVRDSTRGRRFALAVPAVLTGAVVLLGASGRGSAPDADQGLVGSDSLLSGAAVKRHVRALAHDSLRGRFPGSPGGESAARYIARLFREYGLVPGTADGFLDPVPLLATRTDLGSVRATARSSRGTAVLDAADLSIRSEATTDRVTVAGDIVFAGYGIDAAEHGWDDFGTADLAGALVAVIPGLPGEAEALLPGARDSYYAEPEAKLEAARARGASAILFLFPPEDAARFEERRTEALGFEHLSRDAANLQRLDAIVQVSPGAARDVLSRAGLTYAELLERAASPDFATFVTGTTFRLDFRQSARRLSASNVVGVLPGRVSTSMAVLLTAHYDGLGVGPPDARGDSIYNGASDNAAGTGGLLELARVFAERGTPQDRTLIFLATTAEEADYEQIGARHYVTNPVEQMSRTAVVLNLDGLNWRGPTADFRFFPVEGTTAETALRRVAEPLGMELRQPPWGGSMHFSFDTKEFLAEGVVGLTLWQGTRFRVADPDSLPELLTRESAIHVPSDEFHEDWSEEALEQHLALYRRAVEHYANGDDVPQVREGGPLSSLATARGGEPPWTRLAVAVVARMALTPGERVLLMCRPEQFGELVRELRYAVIEAGGVDLGCLEVMGRPYPDHWSAPTIARGWVESRATYRDFLADVDGVVILPGAWPTEPAYAAVQDLLRKGRGRAVHFHWHGGYDLNGVQMAVDSRIERTYVRAVLDTDHAALRAAQVAFEAAARLGPIRVTTPHGTDLEFHIGGRHITRQDGDASLARTVEARTLIDREIEIPAGAVRVAPIEETVNGTLVFPGRTRWNDDNWARDVRLVFEAGRVVDVQATEGSAAVLEELDEAGEAGRAFRAFALGLNPLLAVPDVEPWVPYYGYGAGVVRLSLGANEELGGAVKGDYSRWNFFIDATVTVAGEEWVRDGKLVR